MYGAIVDEYSSTLSNTKILHECRNVKAVEKANTNTSSNVNPNPINRNCNFAISQH